MATKSGRIDMAQHVRQAARDAEATARGHLKKSLETWTTPQPRGPELPVRGVAGKSAEVAIRGKAKGR